MNTEDTIQNRQVRNQYLHPHRNWRYTTEDALRYVIAPQFYEGHSEATSRLFNYLTLHSKLSN